MKSGDKKRILWAVMAALLVLALTACGDKVVSPPASAEMASVTADEIRARVAAEPDAAYLFAVNVGKGDALILRAGDWVGLIDAGKAWARGRVLSALSPMLTGGRLNAVFLTHTDDDHADGLRWMAEADGLTADGLYAPAFYSGKQAEKHPAVKAAEGLIGSADVQWLRRGDEVFLGNTGATLRVLAPASLHEDEDDNSLVMLLACDAGRMLLTGDMELPGEADLLSFGDDLRCDVLKVPNHADGDTTSAQFAAAAAARLAVISTDSAQKPDTPDPGVIARLQAAGSRVVMTQDSELGLFVTLKGGDVTVESVTFGAPVIDGLYIAEVDASDDRVVIGNRSGDALSLSGCYLYSDRGDELFAFPDGTTVAPGETLTVGTYSTKGGYDLLWPDKKVVHKKKTDTLYLYDGCGRVIDRGENGK